MAGMRSCFNCRRRDIDRCEHAITCRTHTSDGLVTKGFNQISFGSTNVSSKKPTSQNTYEINTGFISFSNSSLAFGQSSKTKSKYNFDKGCHSGGQQDCNYCLSKAVEKYSKVMTRKYNCIINYFDVQINLYSKSDSTIAAEYKRNKKILIYSQATWRRLKYQNASYYENGGGTVTPMLVAESMISDFQNRLEWLDNLIQEEGQGNQKLLKCE